MNAFEPRRVAPGAVRRWVREAGALLLRRPLAWSACGVAIAGPPVLLGFAIASGDVARVPGTLLVLLCVDAGLIAACALGIHVAALADEGDGIGVLWARLATTLRPLATPLWLSLLSWGFVYAALVAIGASVRPGLLDWLGGADPAPGQGAATLLGLANIALAPVGGWFALPLLAHANIDLAGAIRLSVLGGRLNARALWTLAPCAGLAWAAVGTWAVVALPPIGLGVALGLCLPPLSALLYVSYRDVFLGRGSNVPARAVRSALRVSGVTIRYTGLWANPTVKRSAAHHALHNGTPRVDSSS